MTRRLTLFSLAIAAIALGACSSSSGAGPVANPNVFPAQYRNEIITTLISSLDDPTGIRDASISDPVLRPAGRDQRYVVCMRFDSRDVQRRYTGMTERIAYFYAGHLNQLVKTTAPDQCAGVVYKPWPELEKYCLAKSCT
jgi:hypothetical protein